MCNRIKAEVGQVVGFGLDQLSIVGFKGVHLGRFASKPKLVCEKMGSGFVKGDSVMDAGQVWDPEWVLGSLRIGGPHLRLKMPKVHRRGLLLHHRWSMRCLLLQSGIS
jgi:hypothetical protein